MKRKSDITIGRLLDGSDNLNQMEKINFKVIGILKGLLMGRFGTANMYKTNIMINPVLTIAIWYDYVDTPKKKVFIEVEGREMNKRETVRLVYDNITEIVRMVSTKFKLDGDLEFICGCASHTVIGQE